MALSRVYLNLYVGSASLLYHQNLVDEQGITSIVRLDDHEHGNLADWPQKKYTILVRPFGDEKPIPMELIREITAFIHAQLDGDKKVLVHCAAGRSRSVAITMAYLAEYHGFGLPAALEHIRENHPKAFPHAALMRSLEQYLKDTMTAHLHLTRTRLNE